MKKNVTRSKFFNSNLTTTISIAMVLFLVGLIITLSLVAHQATRYVKENIMITVVLSDSITSPDLASLNRRVDTAPYVKSHNFISKDSALSELSAELGENPEQLLGYNPLLSSIEINASADYATPEQMLSIKRELEDFEGVKEVVYHRQMMEDVNRNLQSITLMLMVVALLMLIVSIGLINNTIRLQLYSRRFTISTMRLVGATPWFIRRPFIGRSLLNGVIAAVLAIAVLEGSLYYVQHYYGFPLFDLVAPFNVCVTSGAMFILGLLIPLIATVVAVGRYVRIKTDDLYRI